MRLLLIAVTVLGAGCVEYGNAWRVPLGAECDSDPPQLCNDGYGLCYEDRCREWCGLVTPQQSPRCRQGTREMHLAYDTTPDTCVCVSD